MVDIKRLIEDARKAKQKGLSNKEISAELHVSLDTVDWLLSPDAETGNPPSDVKIGWRSIGVYAHRIQLISEIMADIIKEEMCDRAIDADAVIGIAINGIPFATFIAENLGLELIIYKPSDQKGHFSSNFAGLKGKKIIIVDDVAGTGDTIRDAVRELKENEAEAVLAVVLVNKSRKNDIDGVPLRALIRARSMGGTILGIGPMHGFPYG